MCCTLCIFQINNQKQVQHEQKIADDSEKTIQQHSKQNEERVANLENKLSDISKVIGEYERTKCQDQQSIQKLKERVTQLELENTALSQSAQSSMMYGEDDENTDPQIIADKLLNLKELLKSANKNSENTIKFKGQNNLMFKHVYMWEMKFYAPNSIETTKMTICSIYNQK